MAFVGGFGGWQALRGINHSVVGNCTSSCEYWCYCSSTAGIAQPLAWANPYFALLLLSSSKTSLMPLGPSGARCRHSADSPNFPSRGLSSDCFINVYQITHHDKAGDRFSRPDPIGNPAPVICLGSGDPQLRHWLTAPYRPSNPSR